MSSVRKKIIRVVGYLMAHIKMHAEEAAEGTTDINRSTFVIVSRSPKICHGRGGGASRVSRFYIRACWARGPSLRPPWRKPGTAGHANSPLLNVEGLKTRVEEDVKVGDRVCGAFPIRVRT